MLESGSIRTAGLSLLAAVAIAGLVVASIRLNLAPPGMAPVALDAHGVIRQRTTDDCGVAAVAMLLGAAGRPVDLDHFWSSADIPPGGLSLPELAALAARHGLPLKPVAVRDRGRLLETTPWIAHLSWKHYVVVETVEPDRLVIADPRGYRYALSSEAFRRAWSGYALLMDPTSVPRGSPERARRSGS